MTTKMSLIEEKIVVGPFQCNCRLLVCPETGDAFLVDPGDEAPRILNWIRQIEKAQNISIRLRYLLHTHGHLDHIGATRGVKEMWNQGQEDSDLKIALHRGDLELYQNLIMQGQMFGIHYDSPLDVNHFMEQDETIQIGEFR